MPELPEVETMRRGIAGIVGSTIRKVSSAACRRRPIAIAPALAALRRRVVGRRIIDVDRVGKRVVVRLDSADALVFEPRMSGLVLVSQPPTREHLRLRFALGGGRTRELLYWDRRGLGSVRLVDPEQFAARYGPSKIGPDPLSLTSKELQARLCHSRRAIKVALLDQRAVAGIGNLYAAEVLHLARIHPQQRCTEITPAQWLRLQAATRKILHQAIRHEGSTLADGTYRNALNESGRYQNRHRVYARAGKLCATCGRGQVTRIVQAQRSTFFCPVCQPPPRVSQAARVRKTS